MLNSNFPLLTRIGMGAMPLSIQQRPDTSSALAVMQQFFALGGNFIDTANIYGIDAPDSGHNERLIQQAIKLYAPTSLFVATKGGGSRPQDGWSFRGGGRPEQLIAACESSLINLKVPVIDLYYLHGIDPDVPFHESLSALVHLQSVGKIRHIGLSNVTLQQLSYATKIATIAAVQNRMNPFCKADLYNGMLAYCEAREILYVSYGPCGGWHDHRSLANHAVMQKLERKYAVSAYVIMLAWALCKSRSILPIPGMHTIQQVVDNFQAPHLKLTSQDLQLLDSLPDLYTPVFSEVSLPAIHN